MVRSSCLTKLKKPTRSRDIADFTVPSNRKALMYTPTQQASKQIKDAFTYHSPQGNQAARYGLLREKAREFAELIAENSPASREQSLALTHLQEAVMFANAAIAVNEVWEGPVMTSPMRFEIDQE